MDLLITARSFKEILTINVDQHKILNNFCYMMINSEECRSYHNDVPISAYVDTDNVPISYYNTQAKKDYIKLKPFDTWFLGL